MKQLRGLACISLLAVIALNPLVSLKIARATSLTTPDVLITELQTANDTASQEFIELYNNTDTDIDFGDVAHSGQRIWKLQFFSSTKVVAFGFNWDPKTSGLTTISLARSDGSPSIIAARSYFLIATSPSGVAYAPGGVDADLTYASGHMSNAGGGVQLVDVTGPSSKPVFTTHDNLGWYSPTATTNIPSGFQLTPPARGGLQRTSVADGGYIDADEQLRVFVSSGQTTPKEAWTAPAQENTDPDLPPTDTQIIEPDSQPETTDTSTPSPENPIQITELLPNPAAPANDSNDEFLELFNPNDEPVDLTGYSLQTGLTFNHSFTIKDQTIPARGYLVFTSGTGSLTLSNGGGQARLLDSSGQVVASTDKYEEAAAGEAWALFDTGWLWTTSSTPVASNVFTLPQAEVETIIPGLAKKSTKKATAKPVAKKSAAAKTAGAKTKKLKTNSASTVKNVNAKPTEVAQLHPSALASVGVLAVGYGAYEYKQDITNRLRRLRANRAARRALRPKA